MTNTQGRKKIEKEKKEMIAEIRSQFENMPVLWEKYRKLDILGKNKNKINASLEVEKRLMQLEWLFGNIVKSEENLLKHLDSPIAFTVIGKNSPNSFNKVIKKSALIELYVESFYFFAFRLIELMVFVTGKTTIKNKSYGITKVRNKLIAHPNRSTPQIHDISFGAVNPNGPTIKPARTKENKSAYRDPGLYVNIKEMFDFIQSEISKILK